jgi:hypothetical protein
MQSRLRRFLDWDWSAAEESSRRALELAPGSAEVLIEAGQLARDLTRFEESLDLFDARPHGIPSARRRMRGWATCSVR